MFPVTGMIKKIFKSVGDIFIRESKDSFEEVESETFVKKNTQDAEHGFKDEIQQLAEKYHSLLKSVENAERKLKKLKANKANLPEKKFNEINEVLTSFLQKANPVLLKLRKKLDNSVSVDGKNTQENVTDSKTGTENNHNPIAYNGSFQNRKNTISKEVKK